MDQVSSYIFNLDESLKLVCQASLFLNGNGAGEGTHVSLYIKVSTFFMITITHQGAFPFFFLHYHHEQVIPGEHDTILKWPFRHTVSFTLLDQVNSPHCLIVSQNLHHHCHHQCHRHCHHHCHRHCHHHCHHPQELHHQNGERSKAVNVLESFLPDPTWENFSRPPSVQDRKKEQLGFGFPKYSIQSIFFSPIFFDLKVDLFFQSECIIYQINLR